MARRRPTRRGAGLILESPPPSGPLEESAVIDVVLDSLIQLNAKVPARVLQPYVNQRPVHAFVLLSMATDREETLLEMLPGLTGFPWFAAANMLFEDRSPGLVDHLVRTVTLRLTVYVADPESGGIGIGSGIGGSVGCGVGQSPPGYPPHAEYRFESGPRPGYIVLTTARVPCITHARSQPASSTPFPA